MSFLACALLLGSAYASQASTQSSRNRLLDRNDAIRGNMMQRRNPLMKGGLQVLPRRRLWGNDSRACPDVGACAIRP